jgi:ribonuclease Z
VKLIFLGTGGYHPNERRHTAGLFLPELGILLDAGTGTFRVPPRLLSPLLHVFLTHAHLDHVCGLTYLLAPMLKQQIASCTIHAEAHVLKALRVRLFSEEIFPVFPPFIFAPLESTVPIADANIAFRRLVHPGGSVAFRIDTPSGSMAYVTDTTASSSYLDFLRGVDLLIHECYFPDELSNWATETGHSWTSAVAQLAADCGTKQLYLTHIDPLRPDDDPVNLNQARSIFPETHLAEDLMELVWA